jgi:hypothetical protein
MNNELNALVQRLLSGDASVLDDIYSTTEGYVRAFVGKKILGKNVEACIEEIYVKFFSVAKDADLSKFDAQKVLRSIIVEVISDESAKDETLSPLDIKLWSGKDDGSDPSKESRIDPNVATNLIDRVFSQIKETDAEATALFYVQGRRLSEVSQHLAMPEKKVKDILYSAKNKIISEIKRMRDNGEIDLFGMNPISYFAWLLHSERSPQALKEIKEQLSSVLPFAIAKNTNDVEVKKQAETIKESTSEKNASEKMEKLKEVETHSKVVNESNKSEKANVADKVDVGHAENTEKTEKTASSGNVESVDSTNSTDGMGNVDRTGNTDNIENMDRTADAESTFDTVPLSKEPISQNESVAEGEQEQIELPKEENMDDEPAQYIQGNVKSKKAKKEQEDSVQPVEAYHAKRRRSKRHEQESEATKISTAESTAESANEEASSEMTGAKVANSANSDHSETSTVEATATVEITSTDAWYSYENGDEPTQDYMDEGDGDLEDDPEKSQGEQEDDASDGEDFEEEYTDAYEEEFHRSDYENLNEEEFVARRTQQLLDDDDQEVDMPSFVLNEDKNDEDDDGEEDFYALVNQQKKRRKWPWIIIAILCLCGIVFAAKVWKDRNSHKVADAVVKEESQSASAVDADKNSKGEKKDETSSAAVVASGTSSAESSANGSEGSESQSAQAQETTMAVASSTAYKAIYRNLVNTMADSNHVFESGENIGVDQYAYNVYDMNNDGIPELILHYIGNPSCDAVFYTIGTDGNPVQLGTEAGDLRTGYCESPDHSCLYRYSSNGPDTIYERLTIANGRLNVEKLDVLPEGLVDSSGQFTTPMLRLYDKSDLKGLE